jgi:RimJ/RimL family protein N-acetyltransferase
MPNQLSSGEREFASLVAQLQALEEDIAAARATARHATAGIGVALHSQREPVPVLHGERVTLVDGAEIVIRPIEPNDMHELAVGFQHLSALSRFRRFRERIDHLTQEQLTELTHVDHESHEAMVALDAATGEGVGVARYVRVPDDPTRAEVACTVIDAWQGRGVGTALVARLAARAREVGIERCTALILLGNEPARRLLAHVADEVDEHREGGSVDITAQARRAAP